MSDLYLVKKIWNYRALLMKLVDFVHVLVFPIGMAQLLDETRSFLFEENFAGEKHAFGNLVDKIRTICINFILMLFLSFWFNK